jgi:hypothetical protein
VDIVDFKLINMTPKEKARELFNKMYHVDDPMGNYPMCFDTAKQCALIAVDEIIYVLDRYIDPVRSYWEQVKNEIQKI